jgi:hypothetical protein
MKEIPTYDEMLYNEGYRDGVRGEKLRAMKPYSRKQRIAIFFGGLILFAIGYALTTIVLSLEKLGG